MKRHARLLLIFFACVLAFGCGGEGIPRYEVSGVVTFNGEPVPSGKITFEPDKAKGNSGPSSTARISNGVYETAPGKGVVQGPQHVTVYGFDGSPPSEPLPFGRPIFPAYQTSLDVEDEDIKFDVTVPRK